MYSAEVLDRVTGDLVEVNKGHWITVTELGEAYGVGRRKVRAVLHHMGLLQSEGRHGRYRLAPFAVEHGFGKRIDKPKRSKYPFDVISPEGQRLIRIAWDDTLADMDAELANKADRRIAHEALKAFQSKRSRNLEAQEEVCWLRDHHSSLLNRDIALIVGVSEQLVGRYVATQNKQRADAQQKRSV